MQEDGHKPRAGGRSGPFCGCPLPLFPKPAGSGDVRLWHPLHFGPKTLGNRGRQRPGGWQRGKPGAPAAPPPRPRALQPRARPRAPAASCPRGKALWGPCSLNVTQRFLCASERPHPGRPCAWGSGDPSRMDGPMASFCLRAGAWNHPHTGHPARQVDHCGEGAG